MDVTGTDEHTLMLIQWKVFNGVLFTRKQNATIKGSEKVENKKWEKKGGIYTNTIYIVVVVTKMSTRA